MSVTAASRVSQADQAYERLRRQILHGELRPNERLIEEELAERFEISRTPVRELLQRLGNEGLVVRVRRGWRVREHTPEEIGEIYEVRGALESLAARLAAVRGSDEELDRICAIHADEENPEPRTARQHLVELNDGFHQAILDAAHNRRLDELARQSREYYFNHRIALLYSDEEAEASVQGHEAIVRALVARDGDAAAAAMEQHIGQALDLIRAKLR